MGCLKVRPLAVRRREFSEPAPEASVHVQRPRTFSLEPGGGAPRLCARLDLSFTNVHPGGGAFPYM